MCTLLPHPSFSSLRKCHQVLLRIEHRPSQLNKTQLLSLFLSLAPHSRLVTVQPINSDFAVGRGDIQPAIRHRHELEESWVGMQTLAMAMRRIPQLRLRDILRLVCMDHPILPQRPQDAILWTQR